MKAALFGLTVVLSSNSQPETDTMPLSAGSGDRDSELEGKSRGIERQWKGSVKRGRTSEEDTVKINEQKVRKSLRQRELQNGKRIPR